MHLSKIKSNIKTTSVLSVDSITNSSVDNDNPRNKMYRFCLSFTSV